MHWKDYHFYCPELKAATDNQSHVRVLIASHIKLIQTFARENINNCVVKYITAYIHVQYLLHHCNTYHAYIHTTETSFNIQELLNVAYICV